MNDFIIATYGLTKNYGEIRAVRNLDLAGAAVGFSIIFVILSVFEKTQKFSIFYPPTQKATHVSAWMNARGVTLRSLGEGGYASEGSARRSMWRCHGRKSVGLHYADATKVLLKGQIPWANILGLLAFALIFLPVSIYIFKLKDI